MNAKNITKVEELNSDFEIFRLFHFFKIVGEIAIMLLLAAVAYGCFCEIFSWDVHGWREVIAKIFGIAFRLALICGILWLEKNLLIDVVRRYRIGKKKMRNYWKKMYPALESGSVQDFELDRKVRILSKRASSHKFRMQISLGMAAIFLAYAFMVTLCVVLGYESRVSSSVGSMAINAYIIGAASGILGGLSYLFYRCTTQKVEHL